MIRRPPRSTRTDTLFPYTTLFRSDVRLILEDAEFEKLFPDATLHSAAWEFDPRWLLLTVSISERLSRLTGLPIDFQFQPQTHANERHKRSEEHTSELQSLMRISYAVFCLKKKKKNSTNNKHN